MEITISTELGTHKRKITNHRQLVELMVEIHRKVRFDDNDWKED
jgi:hypothetical protein